MMFRLLCSQYNIHTITSNCYACCHVRPASNEGALQVELQGVSLVVLSFFRQVEEAKALADLVKAAGGILGAAVCCAENGGDPNDDWTTCDRDRDELLDR